MINFNHHKTQLFEILLGENHHHEFLKLIDLLSAQGHSKKVICELFIAFHKEIQLDSRTQNDEIIYDRLSDFMDGFTAWGKTFKILPNEPDL